jgi:uncharacterized iron-regulated membrane protein
MLRSVLFWCHLTAGLCAGLVILLMSATGVLLTYERQIIAWGDRDFRSAVPPRTAERHSVEAALASITSADPTIRPGVVTIRQGPDAPVTIGAGARTLFVDAYSGAVIGEASQSGARAFMARLRELHRWLAMSGEGRAKGRAVTGWATAIFAGIVCSGFFLWLPRRWSWQSVRAVLLFRRGVRGKARDFNWHNVVGVWSAVPLLIIVLSALPISFPWANAAVYRMVGEQPPVTSSRPAAPAQALRVDGLDRALARATEQVGGWRSISVRLPGTRGGYALTIDRGDGGQPHLRDTLTVAASGEVISFERFADQTPGRRIRSISRFAHTGEVLGIPGQTVAGLASAGAVLLVWTGLSLASRRFYAALCRRRERIREREQTAA